MLIFIDIPSKVNVLLTIADASRSDQFILECLQMDFPSSIDDGINTHAEGSVQKKRVVGSLGASFVLLGKWIRPQIPYVISLTVNDKHL